MDKEQRNALQRAVVKARRLLEREFQEQLEGIYNILPDGRILDSAPGDPIVRGRLLDVVRHHRAGGASPAAAVESTVRESAFTVLNRFAALKMAEQRGLVRECVSRGLQSDGMRELAECAPGLRLAFEDGGYRLLLEAVMDEVALDLKVLFDRRDPRAPLWPRAKALSELLETLNNPQLLNLWTEDETVGWMYQYFNDNDVKEMRDAAKGGAPRNSRELAVRNQFFTPRYVVEFLTDNTLGRLWYEMSRGSTRLKDQCRYLVRRPNQVFLRVGEAPPDKPVQTNLSQEQLLRQPVHIPHRPLKDPREIRLLDPACGSMHFGLYAFDLFTVIYDEAWEIAHGPDDATKSAETFAPFVAFAATFPDKAAFLREVPRLIVERNIHGIDIDPRAVQIAGLSLWLRAQRAWHQAGAKPSDRPRITRSKLVCAEPMPGEKELLSEFIEQQIPVGERPAFAFLLEKIFDCMALAGEAGSLLRIEDEIRTAIADAKRLWKQGPRHEQALLFSQPGGKAAQGELRLDLSGITDEQFWERAEHRIYSALEAYAEQVEAGGGFQRRLFADDAAQGFAFIDLCRKRYDVAVMNPPFGLMGATTYQYAVKRYPNSYCDFGIAFMDRGIMWTGDAGFVGAITSRSFLSITDAEKFRVNVAIPAVQLIVDLGLDVMDGAWVDSCCQVFAGGSREPSIHFVKARGEILTTELLSEAERQILRARSEFFKMPRSRLSYDVGDVLANLFSNEGDGLEDSGVALNRTGASTFEDERFRRLWWEVSPLNIGSEMTWCFVAKSCEFNLFYYPYENLVKWNGNGDELAERNRQVNEQTAQARQGSSFYFRPGLSFSRRGEPTIAFRAYPASCAFSSNGAVVLPHDMDDALYLLGFLNSSWVRAAVHTQAHKFSYSVGHPKSIRWIAPSTEVRKSVEVATQSIIAHKRRRFSRDDRDNYFNAPFDPGMTGIKEWYDVFTADCEQSRLEMTAKLREIDEMVAKTYTLSSGGIDWKVFNTSVEEVSDPEDIPFASAKDFGSCSVAYAVGTVFGRWDIRCATGERPAPDLPDPFAPLPVCPPGMLQGGDGLPLSPEAGRRLRAEGHYPLDVAWDGILVDDPEHPLDLERRVQAALALLWADRADALEHEACALLGVPTLREWFRRPAGFFADHLKRYFKSRRQAPIYWPLSTASGSYTVWVYYHRLTADTLFKVAELVEFKLRDTREAHLQIEAAQRQAQGREAAKLVKQAGELAELAQELEGMKAELLRVAELPYKPDLNDGVQITAAPLWRLVRLPAWRKVLEGTWKELEKGEYDWAHLACAIWPERVREKCKLDRSLAIAHGLEEVCEVKVAPKKARGRKRRE
jgi:hypothetical protein